MKQWQCGLKIGYSSKTSGIRVFKMINSSIRVFCRKVYFVISPLDTVIETEAPPYDPVRS